MTAALRPRVQAPVVPTAARSTTRRTWGWIATGTAAAATAAGLAFLGNYLVQSSKDLEPNQRMRDDHLDKAVGGTLTGVGVALAVAGIILLGSGNDAPAASPTAAELSLVPFDGGAMLGIRGAL